MVDLKTIDFANSKVTSEKFDHGQIEIDSPRSIAYVVGWQRARRRSGTAQTKLMSEISGTTAKPHKQKGTGQARQGSKRSVQFRGGRTCFGPRPRSFDFAMPKKIIKAAVRDALKLKIQENKLVLFSGHDKIAKTAQVTKLLDSNKISNALFLYQTKEVGDKNSLVQFTRNIKNVKALDFKGLNVYDLLNSDFLLLDKNLFSTIKEVVL